MSPNDKIVTDEEVLTEEELKKENRFFELQKKTEKSAEEQKELDDLKGERKTRFQKKIDKYHWRTKTAEEETQRERELREKAERELEELKNRGNDKPTIIGEEFEVIDGKKWFTDEKLAAMIQANEITEAKAVKYQQERMEEKAADKAYKRIKEERESNSFEEVREKDRVKVLEEFPHFAKNHPDFNPEDPLYKKSTELWAESYRFVPEGLSKSIKRAKEILKIDTVVVDRSDELSVETGRPAPHGTKEKEATLSSDEQEVAERMYCNVVNDKTGNPFTVAEAHAKMLEAKKRRGGK